MLLLYLRWSTNLFQVECHPYLNQERLITFCKTYDVAISCFGTLGSPGTPVDYKSPGVKPVLGDPIITTMAAGMHITPAQLLIRFVVLNYETLRNKIYAFTLSTVE